MDINRLKELSGLHEGYSEKYYTNSDEKEVRSLVTMHLRSLGKIKSAQKIADFILSQELDMTQTQLEDYIEDILHGEFWYPGKKSPFVTEADGSTENSELMAITSELFDIARELKMSKDAKYMASYVTEIAKRIQRITGDQ